MFLFSIQKRIETREREKEGENLGVRFGSCMLSIPSLELLHLVENICSASTCSVGCSDSNLAAGQLRHYEFEGRQLGSFDKSIYVDV